MLLNVNIRSVLSIILLFMTEMLHSRIDFVFLTFNALTGVLVRSKLAFSQKWIRLFCSNRPVFFFVQVIIYKYNSRYNCSVFIK